MRRYIIIIRIVIADPLSCKCSSTQALELSTWDEKITRQHYSLYNIKLLLIQMNCLISSISHCLQREHWESLLHIWQKNCRFFFILTQWPKIYFSCIAFAAILLQTIIWQIKWNVYTAPTRKYTHIHMQTDIFVKTWIKVRKQQTDNFTGEPIPCW